MYLNTLYCSPSSYQSKEVQIFLNATLYLDLTIFDSYDVNKGKAIVDTWATTMFNGTFKVYDAVATRVDSGRNGYLSPVISAWKLAPGFWPIGLGCMKKVAILGVYIDYDEEVSNYGRLMRLDSSSKYCFTMNMNLDFDIMLYNAKRCCWCGKLIDLGKPGDWGKCTNATHYYHMCCAVYVQNCRIVQYAKSRNFKGASMYNLKSMLMDFKFIYSLGQCVTHRCLGTQRVNFKIEGKELTYGAENGDFISKGSNDAVAYFNSLVNESSRLESSRENDSVAVWSLMNYSQSLFATSISYYNLKSLYALANSKEVEYGDIFEFYYLSKKYYAYNNHKNEEENSFV